MKMLSPFVDRVKFFGCLAALLLLLAGQGRTLAATPWLTVQGTHIKDPRGNVVVLRGVSLIDLAGQDGGTPNVAGVIDKVTDKSDGQGGSPGWYPKVIRLPVLPAEYHSPNSWQPGSDTFYDKILRPTVDYCKRKDVYCVIDLHYVDNIDKNPDYVQHFWAYIAPKFARDSNVLFEIYNEPIATAATAHGSDVEKWSAVRGYMQTWYDTIRKSAPKNLCLVGTPQYSQILIPAITDPVIGSNIVYVVHTYPLHWKSPSLVSQIETAAAKIPLFMTEWGFYPSDDSLYVGSTQSNYGRPLMRELDRYGISWTAWVASNSWNPTMFNTDWSLRVGENEMGGFVKDTLYAKRGDNQPGGARSGAR